MILEFSGYFYLGGNDKETEGNWVWEDESEFEFTNWGDGEPSDIDGEDCLMIIPDGDWKDIDCEGSYSLHYVCASPLGNNHSYQTKYLLKV